MMCGQKGCASEAFAKFIWPGHPRDHFVCAQHGAWAIKLAEVWGFRLPLLQITDEDRARAAREVARDIGDALGGDDGEE